MPHRHWESNPGLSRLVTVYANHYRGIFKICAKKIGKCGTVYPPPLRVTDSVTSPSGLVVNQKIFRPATNFKKNPNREVCINWWFQKSSKYQRFRIFFLNFDGLSVVVTVIGFM